MSLIVSLVKLHVEFNVKFRYNKGEKKTISQVLCRTTYPAAQIHVLVEDS